MRILLIGRNPQTREERKLLLRAEGFDATAVDPEEAPEALESGFDCLVLGSSLQRSEAAHSAQLFQSANPTGWVLRVWDRAAGAEFATSTVAPNNPAALVDALKALQRRFEAARDA
ncbi:MAG TPA: hypothetical protein VEG32_09375 [Clostridia bacterium]|nr:hypothetical protein [Clostridia bacterium]